jgi:uncharacterized cupin superfamily protein
MNIDALPKEHVDDDQKLSTLYLGEAAGSEKLYVNIDKVQPGAKSVKYHSHSLQEEFFLILAGTGTLRLNDEYVEVKKGDFFAKPAGKGIAHQFINTGEEVLEILDTGLRVKDDIAYYPDEDVLFARGQRKMFKQADALTDWDSDPNIP